MKSAAKDKKVLGFHEINQHIQWVRKLKWNSNLPCHAWKNKSHLVWVVNLVVRAI